MTVPHIMGMPRKQLAQHVFESMRHGAQNFSLVITHFASGQTEFSASLQRLAAETQKNVLVINCLPSEMDNPFSTVGSLIDQSPKSADMLSVIRQLETSFLMSQNAAAHGTMLLVENAQFMDQESAYILTQLVQGQSLELVLMSTHLLSQRANLEPFESLEVHNPVVLGAMDDAHMAEALKLITGAPPTAGSLSMMRLLSGGLYEIFYLLCNLILEEHYWEIIGGYSVLTVEHLRENHQVNEELVQLYLQMNRKKSQLLSSIVLGGPQPLGTVRRSMPREVAAMLEAGLLKVNKNQEVSVSSVLLSTLISRTVSPADAQELLDAWSRMEPGHNQRGWQHSLWLLAAGQQVPDAQLTASAEKANSLGHYKAAYELATSTASQGISNLRRIQGIRAIASSGQYLEATTELHNLSATALTVAEVESLTSVWSALLPQFFNNRRELENARTIWFGLGQLEQCQDNTFLALRIRALELICNFSQTTEYTFELRKILDLDPPADVIYLLISFGLEKMILEIDEPEVEEALLALNEQGTFGMRVSIFGTGMLSESTAGKQSQAIGELWRTLEEGEPLTRHISALGSFRRAWLAERDGQVSQCNAQFIQATADFVAAGKIQLAQFSAVNLVARNPGVKDPTILGLVQDSHDSLVLGSPLLATCAALSGVIDLNSGTASWPQTLAKLVNNASPAVALQGLWHVHRFQDNEARKAIAQIKREVRELAGRTNSPKYGLIAEVLLNIYEQPESLVIPPLLDSMCRHPEIAGVGWAAVLASESVDEDLAVQARRFLYRAGHDYFNIPVVFEALETRGLSSRELDIARCAAREMSNRQIAVQLNLSVRTIEGHLYRAYGKLGLRDRRGLVSLGLQ